MGKIDVKKLSKIRRQELQLVLLSTFGNLGLNAEGKLLLKDLLTESEIVMLARRMQIARRLLNAHSFRRIAQDLNVGLSTIRNVHVFLEQKFDDYQHFLYRLAAKEGKRADELCAPLNPSSFEVLRQRYPVTYFLFHTLLLDPTQRLEAITTISEGVPNLE